MIALRKPHRIAFLLPDLTIEGADTVYEAEAALLLWTTCLEVCRRHPELAVYDAESTPLFPQDGHFAPQYATLGALPADAFFAPTRRDELLWLEATLPKGLVRLHVIGRSGKRESFEAIGRSVGEQLLQVLAAWLAARQLSALPPKRLESFTAEELSNVVRVLGSALVEHARTWKAPMLETIEAPDDSGLRALSGDDDEIDAALEVLGGNAKLAHGSSRTARLVANRLPITLRVPALRVLELAFREDLGELILAVDPDHPQALFGKFLAGTDKDFALLRRVIAASPGWARPYGELVADHRRDDERIAPTDLETVAGAGMAALCRPGHLDIVETAAKLLREDGRIDEAVRLMTRALRLHDHEPRAHISLLELQRSSDRIGAQLDQAHRASYLHGCPMDPQLPWYPDQIQIDLLVADALMNAGRLDEAIALRANRLEGREATWPRHTRILATWRKDPRFVAWCYAREGWYRGDPARGVEGFGRIEPDDSVDLAVFLDALVAMGREDDVALAWGHYGLGRGFSGPVARLAAARCLLAAGEWRRGLEELWRVELGSPGRDEHPAIARCGLLLSIMPIDVAETALAERMAIGASSLARRMARDIADFVPGAAKSSIVMRALGKTLPVDFDPAMLAGFGPVPQRAAIDALFTELEPEGNERHAAAAERRASRRGMKVEKAPIVVVVDPLVQSDRLVNRWLELVIADEADTAAVVEAAAYVAAQALGRYLAATTQLPSAIAGGLRTVASEALALVRVHADALGDREVRALLSALDPLLRRVDRWVGTSWLATVERACKLDERSAGDVAGFAKELATVAARVLGPEESAVLAASVAGLHRERPDGWEAATAARAARLALHTGHVGVAEWADATIAQLATRTIELDDALDALHTACYLAEGASAVPCVQAARVLFGAGRAPAALNVLVTGIAAATPAWRARELATFADAWKASALEIPLAIDKVASTMFEVMQKGDPVRGEKLGRWGVALDPGNAEAHRNLGLALAQQGKVVDAIHHLTRGTREQATQILSGVLYQSGKVVEAMAVLDYASRWYVRADQWLTYGGVAYGAMDNPRTVKAYALAYQLDPDAFDTSQLNAYAGVLDEVGDYATCEKIANHLLRVAGDDVMWKTNGWNHLACAYIGLGKFAEAVTLAQQAVDQNPLPDNTAGFAATLERATTKTVTTPPPLPPVGKPRDPVYVLLEAGDFAAAAAQLASPSWRVRRAALAATRYRFGSENTIRVTSRARAAAETILADTVGTTDPDAVLCRLAAMELRDQAYFASDPPPQLGDRLTRAAFYREFRARGGVVLGEAAPPAVAFVDREVVPGAKVSRASDYVSLLRDLAALPPREALAQFDLDDAGYLEVAKAWAAAIEADPSIIATISAGLARTSGR
ncbi:MAG: tetratricopeptide repeat protein [Kofleriaceae bacterium]